MDEQLKKKEEILKYVKKRMEEGNVKQYEIVEWSQDINRCDHNIKHIIRGNTNPAGVYTCTAFGGLLGYFWVRTKLPRLSGPILPAIFGILPIAMSSFLFWKIGQNRFSNQGDAKKNKIMLENSMIINEEFKELIKNYKRI